MICHASGPSTHGVLQRFTSGVSQWLDTPGSCITTQTDMLAWHVTHVRGIADLHIRDTDDVVETVMFQNLAMQEPLTSVRRPHSKRQVCLLSLDGDLCEDDIESSTMR